ncbi:MAG: 4-(cytidine 5'-diphospho)-2-C-methyl-D-erythritol kinase [Melioribacteraceae bacterium]|nr:4-(cytidine 5'-diphospho)-2-C-methyl-D-erythritol kinase [Melioribacteraceae bacterium]MDD3557317.1 4-(cytidine 5'-diphospho)-2-C-methyl-D-erythritol kinase [Melioribacteraceae bacterium]
MNSIKVKSQAKINLGLRVLSKRKDGYHNLSTIFYPIEFLYDEIEFSKSSKTKINCNIKELNGNDNLVIKAIEILESSLNVSLPTSVNIEKRIPVGGGLGGGSSNAASALSSLNKLYDLKISDSKLKKYALQLGSDVPFFLLNSPALGESRGEKLTLLNFSIDEQILVVNPGIHISTKEFFSEVKKEKNKIDPNEFIESNRLKYEKCRKELINDFEEIVFKSYPEIYRIKKVMSEHGALFTQMTGTGSTVYGIFNNESLLQNVIDALPENYLYFSSDS